MKKKNAFTLIELIAVLVILATVALIVTPLVMNIVKKAKDSADKRSVDAYGKAVELAVATYLLDTGDYPTTLDDLTVEYSGNEVVCNIKILSEDGNVYLSECSVSGREVKDDNTNDRYYHYGKSDYKVYNIGDQVTYNEMDFYVIAPSDQNQDYVTLLKAEPLTVDEVNEYGVDHVNMYVTKDTSAAYYQKAYDQNGYGGMAYYSSATCSAGASDGCTTDYDASEVKYAVDVWATDSFNANDLKEDSLGYKARLITYEELTTNLGYAKETGTIAPSTNGETPSWVYNEGYTYWTMSSYEDRDYYVWGVSFDGNIVENGINYFGWNNQVFEVVVRPVVNIKKSAIK